MTETYMTSHGQLVVFWQTPPKDKGFIGEPAIIVKTFDDVIELRQEHKTILITRSCVPEFIKALRSAIDNQ